MNNLFNGQRNRLPAYLAAAVFGLLVCPYSARAEDLYQTARELRAGHLAQLEELAKACEQQGLAEQARQARQLYGPRDPYKMYLAVLPREIGRPSPAAGASAAVVAFHGQFEQLRRQQAGELYELAKRAIRAPLASLAYQLVLTASRADPDHEQVRRILGYQKYRGQWRTLFEVRQLRATKVYHERFGWLPRTHVARYERGERFNGRRWITAAQDAELRQDVRYGWVVETEHYAIRTNHSIEIAVDLGEKLERLYGYWEQLFIRYYASEAYIASLFDGGRTLKTTVPRFQVVFFRSRDEYNRALRPAMPGIEASVGIYFQQNGCAYFFAGDDYEDRTLNHEATHQLFHQSRRVAPNVGQKANFWIVEGIAMYMESLRREGDYYVLGGFEDDRLYAALYRLIKDDFYVPLGEFTTFGMQRLQEDKRIATLYSQAAGLANFLVFYDDGRYRDALVTYLSRVYTGHDDPGTLAELTGTPYLELDKQYRAFMEKGRQTLRE